MATYYRFQPTGKALQGHTSGLAYEKVAGIFAFTDPCMVLDTYTWCHISKHADQYELVCFEGTLVDAPADSEGVVVLPITETYRIPLTAWSHS